MPEGGQASRSGWLGGWGVRIYLESLLMTRMSAPFSSFSLWLSAFKSGSIWKGEMKKKQQINKKGGRRRGKEQTKKKEKKEIRLRPVSTNQSGPFRQNTTAACWLGGHSPLIQNMKTFWVWEENVKAGRGSDQAMQRRSPVHTAEGKNTRFLQEIKSLSG